MRIVSRCILPRILATRVSVAFLPSLASVRLYGVGSRSGTPSCMACELKHVIRSRCPVTDCHDCCDFIFRPKKTTTTTRNTPITTHTQQKTLAPSHKTCNKTKTTITNNNQTHTSNDTRAYTTLSTQPIKKQINKHTSMNTYGTNFVCGQCFTHHSQRPSQLSPVLCFSAILPRQKIDRVE